MSDARRKGAAPDLKIVLGADNVRVIVPADAPSAGDDPPPREGLLGVASSIREMAGEVARSCCATKKKLLKLRDEVAQCLPDLDWDDVDEGASPEELVDDVASMVGELILSHARLEEFAEDVRLGLDMTRVEFESWRARGCRPQHCDGAVAAGAGDGRLGVVLGESAEILRGVLGDHE